MIERLISALGVRRSAQPAERQLRPNELRRDVVRAERLLREASRGQAAMLPPPRSLEEQRAPRRASQPTPPADATTKPPFIEALTSRQGLRQAWLLKEILSPPLALRGRGEINKE